MFAKNKCNYNFMRMSLLVIWLMNETLKLFPFALVMATLVWFYFCPDYILSDVVNDWLDADIFGKIYLVMVYLKMVFVMTVVSVFIRYVFSEELMAGNSGCGIKTERTE